MSERGELEHLRITLRSSRSVGSDGFIEELERKLGRSLLPQERNRRRSRALPRPGSSSRHRKPGPPRHSWLSFRPEALTGLNVLTRVLHSSVFADSPAPSLCSNFGIQDNLTGNLAATRSCTAEPTSCSRSRIWWADGLQTFCQCPRPSPWCPHSCFFL